MFSISKVSRTLWAKLRRPAYRSAYLSEHVRRGLAHQIRALRDQRDWKQGRLAKELGKPQSVVSRLEDPSYGKVTIQTLLEVAKAFDVALQVRFVSFSDFIRNTRDLSTASMEVASFGDDKLARGEFIHRGSMIVARTKQRPLLNLAVIGAEENRVTALSVELDDDQFAAVSELDPSTQDQVTYGYH
jgi:transcriptional regulator with XRE-family HTH domain